MYCVSAYLIKQSGRVGTGVEPVSKSKLKDWLKNDRTNYGNHLYFLPGVSSGSMPDVGGGRFWLETKWRDLAKTDLWAHMLAKANNQNANADGFITCAGNSAYLWAYDYNPIMYFGYGTFQADGVRIMEGGLQKSISLRVDRCDASYEALYSETIGASDFLEQYAVNEVPSLGTPIEEGYVVYINMGIPRFSTYEEGLAYRNALQTYMNLPTDENYEALCNTIDTAKNPI